MMGYDNHLKSSSSPGPGLRLLPFDALIQPRSAWRAAGSPKCHSQESSRRPSDDRAYALEGHSVSSPASSTFVRANEVSHGRRRFQPYPSHSQNDRYDLDRLDVATIKCYPRDLRSAWASYPDYNVHSQSPEFSYFSPHAPIMGHQRVMSPSVLTYRDISLRPYLRRAETTPQARPAMVLRTYSDKVLSTNTSYVQSPLSSTHGSPTHFRASPPDRHGSGDCYVGTRSRHESSVSEPDSMPWSKPSKQGTVAQKVEKATNKNGRTGRPASRSRSTGNVCQSCNATSTPEWRKGPMGPRSLCNACGLLYAKMCRKNENDAVLVAESKHEDPAQARQAAIDELSKPEKQQQLLEALRAGVRVVANSKNRVQAGTSLEAGTPVSSGAA